MAAISSIFDSIFNDLNNKFHLYRQRRVILHRIVPIKISDYHSETILFQSSRQKHASPKWTSWAISPCFEKRVGVAHISWSFTAKLDLIFEYLGFRRKMKEHLLTPTSYFVEYIWGGVIVLFGIGPNCLLIILMKQKICRICPARWRTRSWRVEADFVV